jgi:hypothetical protein
VATALPSLLKRQRSVEALDITIGALSDGALVNLSGHNLNDECVAMIVAALHDNFKVTSLDLSYNSITDAGAELLAAMMERNTSLTRVDLDGNSISRMFGAGAAAKHAIAAACEVRLVEIGYVVRFILGGSLRLLVLQQYMRAVQLGHATSCCSAMHVGNAMSSVLSLFVHCLQQ